MTMTAITHDLAAEQRDLLLMAAALSPDQWLAPTSFFGWNAWDEIAHLCFFDEAGFLSVTNPEVFLLHRSDIQEHIDSGLEMSEIARRLYRHLASQDALLGHWQGVSQRLIAALQSMEAKTKLNWYGPPMSPVSFATARLMETWAHGQDLWDLTGRVRSATPGLRHISHLGYATFAWSFINRGLTVPAPPPFVCLQHAFGGPPWTWGDPDARDRIEGPAEDFCLLVTQRRHVADTRLRIHGPVATAWCAIAQCFAGPPADGPRAGMARSGQMT